MPETEQEYRCIWCRLGVTLKLTPAEIDTLLKDDDYELDERSMIVWKAFREGRVEPGGDTYIPGECIADYNAEYGTDYEEAETAWYM